MTLTRISHLPESTTEICDRCPADAKYVMTFGEPVFVFCGHHAFAVAKSHSDTPVLIMALATQVDVFDVMPLAALS